MDYNITGRQNDPPNSGRIGWHLKMLQISFQNSFTCFFDQAMSIVSIQIMLVHFV